jgi:hypothetical protein
MQRRKERCTNGPIEEGDMIPDVILPIIMIDKHGKRMIRPEGACYFDMIYGDDDEVS